MPRRVVIMLLGVLGAIGCAGCATRATRGSEYRRPALAETLPDGGLNVEATRERWRRTDERRAREARSNAARNRGRGGGAGSAGAWP